VVAEAAREHGGCSANMERVMNRKACYGCTNTKSLVSYRHLGGNDCREVLPDCVAVYRIALSATSEHNLHRELGFNVHDVPFGKVLFANTCMSLPLAHYRWCM
jgi:hypothetical protein